MQLGTLPTSRIRIVRDYAVPEGNNKIRFNPVTLGAQVGNYIQILEGVGSGDRVFVELPPGQSLDNLNFGRQSEE